MTDLPNILIVDDNKENLELLKAIFKKININLIQALSGSEALEKTQGNELALAIIDVRMPKMNGFELALKLNEERSVDKVPVIFLTANHFDELEVFKGYNSGAVDYIVKPIDSHILRSKINVFLDLFTQKHTIIKNAALLKESSDKLIIVNTALKKSEEKYRSYIDNAPDGVFIADENGRYLEVNEAACRITGYSKDELIKMSIPDMLPEESLEEGLDHFRKVVKMNFSKADLLFKNKNGNKRWWTVESVRLNENRFLGFAKDITERKMAEEELKNSLEQLHLLAQHIEKAREEERVAISQELHDDLGQALTAVKIDLASIKQNVSDMATVLKINKVSALVSDTIKTVQKLTSQLRPQIIDDLGLETAIEWYTKEFAQRNRVKIFLDIDSKIKTSPENSLIIFRIMQESLTNISRHSKASEVDIKLSKNNNNIDFRISDNGIGITENEIQSKKSFGIKGMKERATSLGGSLDICRENDHGTIIKLIFPYNN